MKPHGLKYRFPQQRLSEDEEHRRNKMEVLAEGMYVQPGTFKRMNKSAWHQWLARLFLGKRR